MTFWLIFQLKITSFACLLGSALKLIFHWKVHLLFLKKVIVLLIVLLNNIASKGEKKDG